MTRLFSKHNGPHGHFTRNNYELVLRCGLVCVCTRFQVCIGLKWPGGRIIHQIEIFSKITKIDYQNLENGAQTHSMSGAS